MGRQSDECPPSEALPDIGDHSLIFHNGKGFYYNCKEYSVDLDKRLFECVWPGCPVTATMGHGSGSPLVDLGNHNHAADLSYRDHCLLLHNIRRRLRLREQPLVILQDAISSLENTDVGLPPSFECVTVTEEPLDDIDIKQEECDIDDNIVVDNDNELNPEVNGNPLPENQPSTSQKHDDESEEEEHLSESRSRKRRISLKDSKRSGQLQKQKKVSTQGKASCQKSQSPQKKIVASVKPSYSKKSLKAAIKELKFGPEGLSVAQVSLKFGIPRKHLIDGLYGPTGLTSEQEEAMVERVESMLLLGFPISKDQLLQIVHNLSKTFKKTLPDSFPTTNWLQGFLKRHPLIKQKLVQEPVNEDQLRDWITE